MRFHWDLTQGCLLRTPKSSARLNTIEFKRGDTATIELFFYANYEGLRRRQQTAANRTILSADARSGTAPPAATPDNPQA